MSSVQDTTKAPVLLEEGQKPVEVTGTVKETSSFQWNISRLLYRQEGESNAKAWTIRVLSVLFVLPAALTVLVDFGRGVGFLIGRKIPTVARYFDGKSWSLIDQVSSACKTVAAKANSIFKSFTAVKKPTLEELNQQFEKTVRSQVAQLVNGYRAIDDDSRFTSKGQEQIAKTQNELVQGIHGFLARNATKTEDFAPLLTQIETHIGKLIQEAAGERPFTEHKHDRTAPPPLLSNKVFNEFVAVLRGDHQLAFAKQFVELVKQETGVAETLKMGVDQGILTAAQAKEVVEEQAPVIYNQGLGTGLSAAAQQSKDFLSSAVKSGLVTAEEADGIEAQIQPEEGSLAFAAAKDVARQHPPATAEAIIQQQLVEEADLLIENKKLDPKDKTGFLTEAQRQLSAAREAVEAEAQAQKQAAEIAEAERAANVQKAENQAALFKTFEDYLAILSKKQEELRAQFTRRDQLDAECQQITEARGELMNTLVTVKGKRMTIFDAAKMYNEAINQIPRSKNPDQKKEEQINALTTDDFAQQTIDLIDTLTKSTRQLQEKIRQMAAISEDIRTQYKELSERSAIYNVYAKYNKQYLEESNSTKIAVLEKSVRIKQLTLDKSYSSLFHRGIFNSLRPITAPIVNVDEAGNRAEVEAILKAYAPAAVPEEVILPDAPPEEPILDRIYDALLPGG